MGERELVAEQVSRLALEVGRRDPPVATVLHRLADAVRNGRHEDMRGLAGAVDPGDLADILEGGRSAFWGALEVLRNVLIFAPIGVTWFGLSTASEAYGRVLAQRPDLVTVPFLLLWQNGLPGVVPFSTLAAIDATLIGALIVLSFLIHVRSEVRDEATRTRILLKGSEIRGLLGQAANLAAAFAPSERESDVLVADMVAEERRIYERGMEREQKLFDLENAVGELREASTELARVAEALAERFNVAPAAEGEQRRRFRRRS